MPSADAVLCDSGPLVALLDDGDAAHEECRIWLQQHRSSLVTTWPVLTEVFHFLDSLVLRNPLWDFILRGGLQVADILPEDLQRMRELMAKYADLPMDFADASLVVVGERLNLRRIFTLARRDFQAYRPRHVRSFDIFP